MLRTANLVFTAWWPHRGVGGLRFLFPCRARFVWISAIFFWDMVATAILDRILMCFACCEDCFDRVGQIPNLPCRIADNHYQLADIYLMASPVPPTPFILGIDLFQN